MARASAGVGGARGTYEECVDHCSDKFPGNSPELTACIQGCATVYGGGRLGGTFEVSREAWAKITSDFLNDERPPSLTTSFRRAGSGATGGTWDCLGNCETDYSRCMSSAQDWFQEYLCKLDALRCVAGCATGVSATDGVFIA